MSKRKRTESEDVSADAQRYADVAKAFDTFVLSLNKLLELTPSVKNKTSGLPDEIEDKVMIAKVFKKMRTKGQLSWMEQYLKVEEAHAPQSTETGSSTTQITLPSATLEENGSQTLETSTFADFPNLQIQPPVQWTSPTGVTWPPALPKINNLALLKQAFTHRSYATVSAPAQATKSDLTGIHNERLEFLGDSFLNHAVTKMLYAQMPAAREGDLSQARARLIGNVHACEISRMYGFDKELLLNDTAERDGVRSADKVSADIFEAYLGALMLDGEDGIVRADQWLKDLMAKKIAEELAAKVDEPVNLVAKQKLWAHFVKLYPAVKVPDTGKMKPPIIMKYEWISGSGGNAGGFLIAAKLIINGQWKDAQELGRGFGVNKKEAEHRAAMEACQKLGIS